MEDLTIEEFNRNCADWGLTYAEANRISKVLQKHLLMGKDDFLEIKSLAEMLRELLSACENLEKANSVISDDMQRTISKQQATDAREVKLLDWKDRALDICVLFLKDGHATAEELVAAINGGGWVVGQKLINDIALNDQDKEYLEEILSE